MKNEAYIQMKHEVRHEFTINKCNNKFDKNVMDVYILIDSETVNIFHGIQYYTATYIVI